MRCAIWNHLYKLKNLKNTHGGVSPLVKLQAIHAQFRFTLAQVKIKPLWLKSVCIILAQINYIIRILTVYFAKF